MNPERLKLLEQRFDIQVREVNQAMQEMQTFVINFAKMNKAFQEFITERLNDIEKHLGLYQSMPSANNAIQNPEEVPAVAESGKEL